MIPGLGRAEDLDAALDRLHAEWPGLPMAVVLVEVDAYEWLLARHGPRRAQHCMELVGAIVNECLQSPAAMAFHLGGPRFAGLLPCADALVAQGVAERIGRGIASQVSSFDGRVVRMSATTTVSARRVNRGQCVRADTIGWCARHAPRPESVSNVAAAPAP